MNLNNYTQIYNIVLVIKIDSLLNTLALCVMKMIY